MQANLEVEIDSVEVSAKIKNFRTIAYILDSFPNVSETFVSNEINELIKLGWTVKIFALHRPNVDIVHDSARTLLQETVYLPRLVNNIKILKGIFSLIKFRPKKVIYTFLESRRLPGPHYKWTAKQATFLANEVRKAKCERIHVHFASEAARYGMFVSKFLNIPMTLTVHSPLGKNESQEHTLNIVGRHANAVITVSNFNKSYICQRYGLDPKKIHVNPNGIQDSVFKFSSNQHRVDGRILTVARLHPDKGIRYAIEAANYLRKAGKDFEWIIVGDGPEREEMQTKINSMDLKGHVKLLGFQPATSVVEEFKRASIFVLSSVSEAQPVVYLEAMATGTPIIGTDIPGVSETIINGETGFLVPIADAKALALKISLLLENEILRKRFSDASVDRVKQSYLLTDRVIALTNIWSSSNSPSYARPSVSSTF
jgi:colanic acid/amylovoran biosynthesis glycosyltransferase